MERILDNSLDLWVSDQKVALIVPHESQKVNHGVDGFELVDVFSQLAAQRIHTLHIVQLLA